MNVGSEQITLDKNLVIDQDQPLNDRQLQQCLMAALGEHRCCILKVPSRKWILEYTEGDRKIHLLVRNCTYLGNPHPIYKKRVQLPLWFNKYCVEMQRTNPHVDIRYIGVYHYGDKFHGDNIIFVDFKKDTYLLKKGHNSSAHVYTNDFFQAMTYGLFQKEDAFGNSIAVVKGDRFCNYLMDRVPETHNLFGLFRQFNQGFAFGQWLEALDSIREMHQNGWSQWRQAEWAGWFLEFKYNKFITENHVMNQMRYVGCSLKKDGDFDFDVCFEDGEFYGDLKASDITKKETPGNDQANLVECICRSDKFWYIIYEHETIKDSARDNYMATRGRNRYIKSVDSSYNKDELSYCTRMKSKVRFVRMTVIELNRINFRDALTDFNQGRQPDGNARKPKFSINKKVLENDNFVVFRYVYRQ